MTIETDVFNQAVADATAAVKPLLLAVEAEANELGLNASHPLQQALSALHAELANQLEIADSLGNTDGLHARTGGSDKGDGG